MRPSGKNSKSVSSFPSPSYTCDTCVHATPSADRSRIDFPWSCQYAVTYHVAPSSVFGRQKSHPAGSIGAMASHAVPSALDVWTVPTGVARTVRLGSM